MLSYGICLCVLLRFHQFYFVFNSHSPIHTTHMHMPRLRPTVRIHTPSGCVCVREWERICGRHAENEKFSMPCPPSLHGDCFVLCAWAAAIGRIYSYTISTLKIAFLLHNSIQPWTSQQDGSKKQMIACVCLLFWLWAQCWTTQTKSLETGQGFLSISVSRFRNGIVSARRQQQQLRRSDRIRWRWRYTHTRMQWTIDSFRRIELILLLIRFVCSFSWSAVISWYAQFTSWMISRVVIPHRGTKREKREKTNWTQRIICCLLTPLVTVFAGYTYKYVI